MEMLLIKIILAIVVGISALFVQSEAYAIQKEYVLSYVPNVVSPLKQLNSGISVEDIQCGQKDGQPLVMYLKAEDHSPVCLTQKTSEELWQRKWLETQGTPYDNIAEKKAKGFILSSPTLKTFGIMKTLIIDTDFTCDLTMSPACQFQATFDAKQLGYGNGTNSMLNSTKTTDQTIRHFMIVRIYKTNLVECAIIDGTWDEKNQKPIDKNDKLCYPFSAIRI